MKSAVRYRWTKGTWVPLPAFAEDCDREFAEGEERWLDTHFDRSMQSHNHYFAALNTSWSNLPEDYRLRFATPQSLRKWCLIEAGWYTTPEPYTLVTPSAALRLAHHLTRDYPADRIYGDPADPRTLVWKIARSQSMRAMGKKDFQASKDAVLDKAAELI